MIDFVEAERRHSGLGRLETDVGLELPNGRQVGQALRVVRQMPQSDERVGLAAAVVDGKLAVRLVGLPGQPQADILDQLPEVVGRKGEGEELRGVFVDWPLALLHDHVIQVGGEYG